MNASKTVAVAYIPVLHQGYVRFVEEAVAQGASTLYLIGDDILAAHEELDYMNRKDRIRAVLVKDMATALSSVMSVPVSILTLESVRDLADVTNIVMPQEDVSVLLKETYFPSTPVAYSSIFLRWHRDNSLEEKSAEAHRTISISDFDKECMKLAHAEAEGSFDWWRQVGAVIAKDGTVILGGRNEHVPDEQSPNIVGDPRTAFKKGVNVNLTTALHAEGSLIAEAARRGISLEGSALYVTDFPCPFCAKMVAHSGIKKCFFSKGYAMLDGETVLKDAGVELIFVDPKG